MTTGPTPTQNTTPPQPRTGQAPPPLERAEFRERFLQDFRDPRFADEAPDALDRIEAIAWRNYDEGRKAPRTRKAGPGYADPDYDLSVDWIEAKERIDAARTRWADKAAPARALLVCGSARNDGTCPGEISKSWRMLNMARDVLAGAQIEVDLLDLSRVTSDYGRHIHPCKGCVSTAMPLCHFPCSCYPNHAERQTGDWMNEIYERFTAAHGVMIITPVYWYQAPSPLKLMIDRLVCADGGNPDPTTTHGKKATEAKALELAGWDYPKHLAGRAYALAVHGDVAGIEMTRRGLSDWLDWMGFIDAGPKARLDRYIGYYESYAQSHEVLDRDTAMQAEVRGAAEALSVAITELRAGRLVQPDAGVRRPRPK
ncbi:MULTISPECIES: flavodoxin family protein [unclassified Acidovorax]|uniref:flavodoxin family protein n=1 Tax=unclassified Acidovorax TaxID=2684926 RepID=UPI003ECF8908